jgi:hypothetical protein
MRPAIKWFLPSFLCFWLGGLVSCDLNKIDYTTNDSANVQNETVVDAYFEDVTDMSSTAVSVPNATNGGRDGGRESGKFTFTIADPRFACAVLTLEISNGSTPAFPRGVITADFGVGCADNIGNTRKGQILITYSGRRFLSGSSIVVTFKDYEINAVKMDGSYTLTNTTDSEETTPKLNITLANGMLTWPDGTTALRESQYTREWIRTSGGFQDQLLVTGSATGQNRQMQAYTMTITQQLVFQKSCLSSHPKFLATQGKEELIINPTKIDIDFGNGACDEVVTVSINGKSKNVDVSGNN